MSKTCQKRREIGNIFDRKNIAPLEVSKNYMNEFFAKKNDALPSLSSKLCI